MKKISAADNLPWTGERLVPGCQGQVLYEHLHRYGVAVELVKNKSVLDIACGEGYGPHLLSRVASRVTGVDIDPVTIRHARKTYAKDNLLFREGSCLDIPAENHSFDVVVSFETIEHLADHARFLLEIKRVLTADGLLVISSPDKRWYSDRTGQRNPFHELELYHEEFERLMRSHFRNCRFGKQQMVAGSWIACDRLADRDSLGSFSGDIRSVRFDTGVADGVYSIAFCSDAQLPPLHLGVFENRRDSQNIWNLLDRYPSPEEIQARIAVFEQTLGRESELKKRVRDQEATIRQSQVDMARQDGRIFELQQACANLERLLQAEQLHRNELHRQLERVRVELDQRLQRAQKQLDLYEEQEKKRDQQHVQITEQLKESCAEAEKLRSRFLQTNDLLQRLSGRASELESRNHSLTERLRKQLLEMKRLVRLLDQIGEAAALLRRSRRWKMANPFSAIRAALVRKPFPGFGHLDKNVERYRLWRASHPEVDNLADEIQLLRAHKSTLPSASEKKTSSLTAAKQPPSSPTSPIRFPQYEEVEVSLIIPVYNQLDFTLACLASVQQNSGEIPYELIVVDDASTDRSREVIAQIPGLVYLREQTNSGFIAACNKGAAVARGRFLVFLNNDTTVMAGWLNALRDTFQSEPNAGLVGSKLVYPDGRLQEAGGIIWRDGTGWNRGKFQDPGDPEYNYLREVDYCSAASLMIPTQLFRELGGFDQRYAPAYYEDTDLAFKVAQAGRKVLYQPLSVVVHYEGATAGSDTAVGTKRYQEINRATFEAAWHDQLQPRPVNADLTAWDSPVEGRHRILVIDHHLPMPDRDSGSLRMFHILVLLRNLGHQVTFLPDNVWDIPPYGDHLRARGIRILHRPYVSSIREFLQFHGSKFDVIILSRCDFARKHVQDVREFAPQARLIFDTVDLHFLRDQREAVITKDPATEAKAQEKREIEFDLIERADQTWVVSPTERNLILSSRPQSSVEIVSNIVDVPGSTTPFKERRDILFIGSFQHPPNTDAVLFFTRDIFPLIQERLPDLRFYIIGDKPPSPIVALSTERVIVTGYQPDVSVYFNTIKLSIAPLRYGAGVKGKINQSMGFGVPVVATNIAVEGMELNDREDILIADSPQWFSAAVVELYQSEELWTKLSANAIRRTHASYSTEAAKKQLQRLFSRQDARSGIRRGEFTNQPHAQGCATLSNGAQG